MGTDWLSPNPIHGMTETAGDTVPPSVEFHPPHLHDEKYREKIKAHARETHWEYVARRDQSGDH
jgi:hypothetical protein